MNAEPRLEVKVRCENNYWARQIQLELNRTIGAEWGYFRTVPWRPNRNHFLIVMQNPFNKKWFFTWCPEREFVELPGAEYSAKALCLEAKTR